MKPRIPSHLIEPLQAIQVGYTQILAENLVGLYVHGSVAMGCYNPHASDIDFLALVNTPISIAQKKAIIQLLLQLSDQYSIPKGLEMSIVLAEYAHNFVYPTPFLLHYSQDWQNDYQNGDVDYNQTEHVDPDLAAHFTVTRARGFCLCGQPILDVFGEVPEQDYLASLLYDLEDVETHILIDPVYNGLNLCRVWYYLETGQVASKKEGGEWAQTQLPQKFLPILNQLLAVYQGDKLKTPWPNHELTALASDLMSFIQTKVNKR